jgi:hypothetical protein
MKKMKKALSSPCLQPQNQNMSSQTLYGIKTIQNEIYCSSSSEDYTILSSEQSEIVQVESGRSCLLCLVLILFACIAIEDVCFALYYILLDNSSFIRVITKFNDSSILIIIITWGLIEVVVGE